jgi:hypothetical protein
MKGTIVQVAQVEGRRAVQMYSSFSALFCLEIPLMDETGY